MEELFPGVERSILVQIIENRFKPTNIYRLLATEKERAESQRMINIGGIEFEQTERDGKESEYRISSFFKAWAAYSGILVKLAPYSLQAELTTALFIYTMNLYNLLEKYTWDGVKAYHFQFNRKRVASGKNIFMPQDWRQLDSELIASKCFANPVPRTSWNPTLGRPTKYSRQISELPLREYPSSSGANNAGITMYDNRGSFDRRLTAQSAAQSSRTAMALMSNTLWATQICRNWNHRECRYTNCRNQHVCIICGSGHKASQCNQGGGAFASQTQTGRGNRR